MCLIWNTYRGQELLRGHGKGLSRKEKGHTDRYKGLRGNNRIGRLGMERNRPEEEIWGERINIKDLYEKCIWKSTTIEASYTAMMPHYRLKNKKRIVKNGLLFLDLLGSEVP